MSFARLRFEFFALTASSMGGLALDGDRSARALGSMALAGQTIHPGDVRLLVTAPSMLAAVKALNSNLQPPVLRPCS